jgi:transcription initiation factor TFIID subunit TAF12
MHEDHLKLSRDAQRAKQERTRQQQQQQQQQQSPNRNRELEATITLDQAPRRMADSTSSVEHTIEDSYMMLGGRVSGNTLLGGT